MSTSREASCIQDQEFSVSIVIRLLDGRLGNRDSRLTGAFQGQVLIEELKLNIQCI